MRLSIDNSNIKTFLLEPTFLCLNCKYMQYFKNNIHHIVDTTMLHSVLIDNMGLFHGKTGIAIALYHFSKSYDDYFAGLYADEIIDQIYEKKNNMDTSFENGLAGIAWGMCYMLENDLLAADSPKDIFDDIDKIFLKYSYKSFEDKSLSTGVEGVYAYVLARERVASKYQETTVFCQDFISELEQSRTDKFSSSTTGGHTFSIENLLNPINKEPKSYGLFHGWSSVILQSCLK